MLRRFLILLSSLTAFLLTMFMGWGIGNLSGFFSDRSRTILVLLLVGSAGVATILRVDTNPLRRGRLPVGTQSATLMVLAIASVILVWFLPFSDQKGLLKLDGGEILRYVGLSLCVLGIAIRLLAMATLGRQFSAYVTLQEGHRLVNSGIYRVIRHPLYLSLLLAGPGFALVFKSMLALPITIAALLFIGMRMRQEESLLELEFGESFREYRRNSWHLIPFVH